MSVYEQHITITPKRGHDEHGWYAWCQDHGVKPLKIALLRERGAPTKPQVMYSLVFKAAHDIEAKDKAKRFRNEVENSGFSVARDKLEIPFHAYTFGALAYAESHLKFLLYDDQVASLLATVPDGLGVSESIWRAPHGMRKIYVTRRVHPDPEHRRWLPQIIEQAGRDFAADFDYFSPLVYSQESEVAIYDSNPGLDAEWL